MKQIGILSVVVGRPETSHPHRNHPSTMVLEYHPHPPPRDTLVGTYTVYQVHVVCMHDTCIDTYIRTRVPVHAYEYYHGTRVRTMVYIATKSKKHFIAVAT